MGTSHAVLAAVATTLLVPAEATAGGPPQPATAVAAVGPPPLLAAPDPQRPEPASMWMDPGARPTDLDALDHIVAIATHSPSAAAADGRVRIADERGGPALTITYPERQIAAMSLLRGRGGSAAAVQLAVTTCAALTPHRRGCAAEIVAFTLGASPALRQRTTPPWAFAAASGLVDRGRRLAMVRRGHGKTASCRSSFVLRDARGRLLRRLGQPPRHDRSYPRCFGPEALRLRGRWALATVGREDENEAWVTEAWAIDVTAGRAARWRAVGEPARGTAGSGGGGQTGPGLWGDRAVWQDTEWLDFSEGPGSWLTDPAWPDTVAAPALTFTDLPLGRPGDRRTPRPLTPIAAPWVAGSIAATGDAVYLATSQGVQRLVPARAEAQLGS